MTVDSKPKPLSPFKAALLASTSDDALPMVRTVVGLWRKL